MRISTIKSIVAFTARIRDQSIRSPLIPIFGTILAWCVVGERLLPRDKDTVSCCIADVVELATIFMRLQYFKIQEVAHHSKSTSVQVQFFTKLSATLMSPTIQLAERVRRWYRVFFSINSNFINIDMEAHPSPKQANLFTLNARSPEFKIVIIGVLHIEFTSGLIRYEDKDMKSYSHFLIVNDEKSRCTAIAPGNLSRAPKRINLLLLSSGTVTSDITRIFSSENRYSSQVNPSSVLYSTWSVGPSSFTMTKIEPESPNSHMWASLCTSSQVKPASRLRKVSDSLYGFRDSPTLPTAIRTPTMPGLLNVVRGSRLSVYPCMCRAHLYKVLEQFTWQRTNCRAHRPVAVILLSQWIMGGRVQGLPASTYFLINI